MLFAAFATGITVMLLESSEHLLRVMQAIPLTGSHAAFHTLRIAVATLLIVYLVICWLLTCPRVVIKSTGVPSGMWPFAGLR